MNTIKEFGSWCCLSINERTQAQGDVCSIFARKVKEGVQGIRGMATAYRTSAWVVPTLKLLSAYNIVSVLRACPAELTSAIAGIMSYAIVFNLAPELMDITMKFANVIGGTATIISSLCIRFLITVVKRTIVGLGYLGPKVLSANIKFANAIYDKMQVILKAISIAGSCMGQKLIAIAIEGKKNIIDLMKLIYEWRGTAGIGMMLGVAAYYDMDRIVDLLQWIYEQYGNISRSARTIDWTARVALQGFAMAVAFLTGAEGVARVMGWYHQAVNALALIGRYEYAPAYRGMLSIIGTIGVMLYYDLEMALSISVELLKDTLAIFLDVLADILYQQYE